MEIDAAKLIEALRAGEPQIIAVEHDGIEAPVAVLPQPHGAAKLQGVKEYIDSYRKAPERSTGVATAFTLSSFIDLFKRHKDEHSAVFADIVDPANPSLLGVFDYSQNSANPRFGQHRLRYEWPISEEWDAWRNRNLKAMSQAELAEFIDDRIADIGEASDHPDAETVAKLLHGTFATPAQIYTLSRGLAVSASISVKQAVSLEDGRISVQFEEGEHKGDDGKPIKVPNLFVLNIPIFVGGPAVPIIGRLRYKLAGGKISWHFDLWQIRNVTRRALLDDVTRVGEAVGVTVYGGIPEV